MIIETYLVEKLNADSTLDALIDERIFPVAVVQGTALPRLTYRRISGSNGYDLQGPDGLRTVTTEVRCWARDYPVARTLADHVRRIMDGYREAISAGPFRMVRVADGEDDYDETVNAFLATALVSMTYDSNYTEPD